MHFGLDFCWGTANNFYRIEIPLEFLKECQELMVFHKVDVQLKKFPLSWPISCAWLCQYYACWCHGNPGCQDISQPNIDCLGGQEHPSFVYIPCVYPIKYAQTLVWFGLGLVNQTHKHFWAFAGPRMASGLILMIFNMVIPMSFTSPTHRLAINVWSAHWGLNKMVAILQTTFSNAFSG